MAIVEAAASGLQVVSTRVGGIPEVLPPELITLSEPTVSGLVAALNSAISLRKRRLYVDPYQAHQLVSSMYNWRDIARRTEVVYDKVNFCCNPTDPERMSIFMKFGYMTGPLFCLVLGLGRILMWLCNLFVPIEDIDIAVNYPISNEHAKQNTL
ncbi:Phosphatidylinositol N-acetylglucosaminyltransferase subunit A [Folsomia candida]|uniref:Phosphatidylinositol N-acetylglucosaminyltransferase subunit A n=2 Tax=Folsomia candida TaxID=158441 RepID=A0A226EVH5_FOLCA|nr:Phosphatidylinositol N-acetylglucosaminyltransferase subunit A [Folsomia candida]